MSKTTDNHAVTTVAAESLREAWNELINNIGQARNAIEDPELWAPPPSPRNLAEGYRYVLGYLYGTIARCLGPTVENPYFVRAIQPLNRTTIDNADAIYLTAPIDGHFTYTIRGRAGDTSQWQGNKAPEGVRKAPHYVIFETPSGFSGDSGGIKELKPGTRANCHTLDSSKLQVNDDGTFEIILAPHKPEGYVGNFMYTRTIRTRKNEEGEVIENEYFAEQVMLRELFCDWENEDLLELFIYRNDRLGKPIPTYDANEAANQIRRVGEITRNQVHFWNEFYALVCDAYGKVNGKGEPFMPRNAFNKPNAASLATAGGMATNIYCGGMFELGEDEALIVELNQPIEPAYIGFHLANLWGESFDFASHQSSLNGLQGHRDSDNVYRYVIAHTDPGVANWVDTTSHPVGYMSVRWAYPERPTENLPWAIATKVKFDDISRHLPSDTKLVDPLERSRQIAIRQEHVQRRYRHH